MAKILISSLGLLMLLFFLTPPVRAMPLGTLLYRTSSDGLAYGYNQPDLLRVEKGIIKNIYTGHVAIYVGQEDGVDYIVEAMPKGIIKVPAKYFINTRSGEEFIGAKIPKNLNEVQRLRVVEMAKFLATQGLKYDFDFQKQKGPQSSQWTCVGLTEKLYESANAFNPYNLNNLVYYPPDYALNITPDGFDNVSIYNQETEDCFSKSYEFSRVSPFKKIILPAPELIGYDAGYEYRGERYFFFPQTQYEQKSLEDVEVDIEIASDFSDQDIRGSVPQLPLLARWSLINNPISSLKKIGQQIARVFNKGESTVLADPMIVTEKTVSTSSVVVASSKTATKKTTAKATPAKKVTTKKSTTKTSSTSKKVITSAKKSSSTVSLVSTKNSNPQVFKTESVPTKKTTISSSANKKASTSLTPKKTTTVKTAAATQSKPLITYPVSPLNPVVTPSASSVLNNNQSGGGSTVNETPNSNPPVDTNNSTETNTNITTTSDNILTNNNENNNSNLEATSSEIVVENQNTNSSETPTSSEAIVTSTPEVIIQPELPILIGEIYITENDDYIELYNPNEIAIDLAAANYRLEKTKTAVDPGILMRIGNVDDGSYPGGTVIGAHGSYLIVRDEARLELRQVASAIATDTAFTFDGSGYSVYLATGAVSDLEDEDIMDVVGFGSEAVYFSGSAPAPDISLNQILARKAQADSTADTMRPGGRDENSGHGHNSYNNSQDFIVYSVGTENPEGEINDNPTSDSTPKYNGFNSPDLVHLWHFDDCRGGEISDSVGSNNFTMNGYWRVGKWGCAYEHYYKYPYLQTSFSKHLNISNATLSFYYQGLPEESPRMQFRFFDSNNSQGDLKVIFDPYYTEYANLPSDYVRNYEAKWPRDGLWHQGVLVLNSQQDYWALYLDGELVYQEDFQAIFSRSYKGFEIGGNNGYINLDEVALWQRALGAEEIKDLFTGQNPLYPNLIRPVQVSAQKVHSWNFNERLGELAKDAVATDDLEVKVGMWVKDGHEGGAIASNKTYPLISRDFTQPQKFNDLSLDFWWRNQGSPNESRGEFKLLADQKILFGLIPSQARTSYYFNGQYDIIGESYRDGVVTPRDDLWHHLALVYDSYQYQLNFYIDGVLKWSKPYTWILDEPITRLQIDYRNFSYEIDDLNIWQGALTADQIKEIYTN